jgi:hypothetical protein
MVTGTSFSARMVNDTSAAYVSDENPIPIKHNKEAILFIYVIK